MEPADIYAWITGPMPETGCDGFDVHVLGSMLALSMWQADTGRTSLLDAVGLDGDVLADLTTAFFPHTAVVFDRLRGQTASTCEPDEACLRDLLRRQTTDGSALQRRLADMVARRCLRPNHLWQDLGLRNRRELSWLMARHFEPLASRNRTDMKWKKFLYRTICRDASFTLCAAPVCAECDDFDMCFGDETGESLLARTRRAGQGTPPPGPSL